MMKNKRGEEKLISMYWFLILTLIAGGIVLMVNTFYSSPYDVREIESEILANKVADCVFYSGEVNKLLNSNGVFREEFRDNFLDRCNFNFDALDEFRDVDYYASAGFYSSESSDRPAFLLEDGNVNLIEDCNVEASKKKLGKCYENEFWAKTSSDKVYLVKILTIVKKVQENAR